MDLVGIKRMISALALSGMLLVVSACENRSQAPSKQVVALRLGVALTPQELASFQPALELIDSEHPEWEIVLETTPQSGILEKINTQLASGDLPDVLRVQGLMAHQWIRKGAFLTLDERVVRSEKIQLSDYYIGPLEQFQWEQHLYGIPDTAAPDVIFYNKAMFDTAGLDYPDDDWTYIDMRNAALKLTFDASGRTPLDSGFDPHAIEQWGWNGSLTHFWQRHLVQAFGADFCANSECTDMVFTAPETIQAAGWWARLVNDDFVGLYDPYGGSQTGVPGDPFINGFAAMGYNGYFAVGQINQTGSIDYDIVQPLLGSDGKRYTPLSTNGYVIAATSKYPDEAWELILALTSSRFTAETWGRPGHAVPAQRSAAGVILESDAPPQNKAAILAAMEYGRVFRPYTSSAFEVYDQTSDLFMAMMKGETPVESAMREIEKRANLILTRDGESP